MKIFSTSLDVAEAKLSDGQFVSTVGTTTIDDGGSLRFYIVTPEDYGKEPDGVNEFYTANGNVAKIVRGTTRVKDGVLEFWNGYSWESNMVNIVEEGNDFPYIFDYPTTVTELESMKSNAASNSIGFGGSTWWCRPCAVGRKENGVDVVYRGDTYGTPENRELEQGSMDSTLWTNKRLGEAVIKLTRLEISGSEAKYSAVGLNDKLISYREDEHHQPAVWFNRLNGQLITSWGARNSARDQDGNDVSPIGYIRYGQDISTLCTSETTEYETTADYSQGFWVGSTSFLFRRQDVGKWEFIRGSGGQNYENPTRFLETVNPEPTLEDQFYIALSICDKYESGNPTSSADRTIVQCFGQPHPTNNPDNKLYHCYFEHIQAGTEPLDPFRNGGGVFVKRMSDGAYLGGNNGRLDSNFTPIQISDMDMIYDPGPGKTIRLLDVQYNTDATVARALIAQWIYDWVPPATMPLGKTYDLILVEYDGTTTKTVNIATGLRGDLGYNKYGTARDENGNTTGTTGIEGTTYVFGASFYRGKDYSDVEPVVYYCNRTGDDLNTHSLHKVTLNSTYSSVVSDNVIVGPTNKILYRPEMTLGGDKRILWYNEADGWSSYNSWVAKTRWLDETA